MSREDSVSQKSKKRNLVSNYAKSEEGKWDQTEFHILSPMMLEQLDSQDQNTTLMIPSKSTSKQDKLKDMPNSKSETMC